MSIQTNKLPDNPQIEVIKSGKTGLFTNYIYKAIPLAFDESMSYYETLLGLLHYLKNVIIPTVNNNADAVAELQTLYEELRTYVDDYFKGLDVQEEINNKLDEMVEDGTLQEIISSYLNSRAIFGFDNVESMKNSTNLIDGSYAETLGFYNKNDGGGALYKIRTITNDDVVNEMDIISMGDSENNLIAELISNKYNVLCYGVTHDDSNNNNHTIIKYVIDKNKRAICNDEITLKNTIVIDNNDVEFNFNKINYVGNTHAILLNNSNITLNGEYINSLYDGIRLGLSNLTMFCNIKINRIYANNIGILLGGSAGVYYDTIDINRLDYKTNGVKILLDDYHVGEINFYNTSFSDLNNDTTERFAFHCHATNYRATGFKFYNVSIEGAHGGFYFEGIGKLCEYLQIYGLRATEYSYKNYKVLKIKCNQTTIPLYGDIFFDNAKPSAFDFSEYTVGSNDALILHGAFRNDFVSSNGLLGYEGHPSYTRLVITKLPRGYDPLRTGDSVQLVKSKNIAALYNTDKDTLKIKFGDNTYMYNGKIKLYVDNANINTIEIYSSDNTLVKTITISNRPCIIDISIEQVFQSNQTELIYSISNVGATSLFS